MESYTVVTINIFAAYRSPTNFVDRNTYRPDRWLDDPQSTSDNRGVFLPFSIGSQSCIGKQEVGRS